MRNICLRLSYDGTAYHGFQRQPEFHGPTIQGSLELAWKKMAGEEITLNTAGRTDKGVHATGQVVNFESAARIPDDKIPKAMNSLLPRDIRILKAESVEEGFHARYSAKWKRYDYTIDNRPIADVFTRLYTLHEPIPLRVGEMKRAALLLEGKHNFKAFCSAGGVTKTFERTLYVCRVQEKAGVIRITCIGNGFLYNMVRIIAGTLINVGKGWLRAEAIPDILQGMERKHAGVTAQPQGLTLSYVHYGEETPYDIFPEYLPADSRL